MNIVLITCLLIVVSSAIRIPSTRFSIHDKSYTPKTWKLIHRSIPVPPEQLKPPPGVKPDDYFKFIPTLVGTITPGKPLTWSAPCFQNNSATFAINGNTSASLTIRTHSKSSPFCDDVYMFAYVGAFDITYFEVPFWDHSIQWDGGWSDGELYDLNMKGIRVFRFPTGVAPTAEQIFETMMMFLGPLLNAHVPEWAAEDNVKFLADHMNVQMPIRNITSVSIPESEFKSGDFLGIIRLDGLDPMLAWGMGSHTGHTAITMWINKELFVLESTTNSKYWPTNGIQRTPMAQWLVQAKNANYNVVHLPLDPNVAKKFNADAAYKYFQTIEGLPYGFHNLFTGWIDTTEDNFPPPLTSELAMLIMPFGEFMLFREGNLSQTFDFLRQGLNKRLQSLFTRSSSLSSVGPSVGADSDLSLIDTFMVASQKGIKLMDLVTMPEMDVWNYKDETQVGPSMVCDVLVARLWKEGGLFGSLYDSIQVAEFTNWDAYSLNFFDANYVRPSQCVQADPDSQFCQLEGKFRMSLPNYNTFAPYAHMREKCPSTPPDYKKPIGC